MDADMPTSEHDPTGTDVAERIAATARGAAPVPRRRRRTVEEAEPAWSGPGRDPRDPLVAGEVLDKVLKRRGWQKQISIAALMSEWAQFVGDVNAQHTKPEKYEGGLLIVRAESTTWATALRAMSPLVIRKMNDILGPGTITRLQILGPVAPSWKKGPRSVPGRGPRDTYG